MQPEKRRTIESFFHSFKKKPRTDEEEIELNVINSSFPSSSLEFHDLSYSSPDNQGTSNVNSVTPSSSVIISTSSNNTFQVKSVPDDISKSCNDLPVQPKLTTYPINAQKRSFQSSWYKERSWLEYSIKNDMCYCYYCRHFSCNRLITRDAFTTTGFNN